MADVFLSYAKPSLNDSRRVAAHLRSGGHSVWFDDARLPMLFDQIWCADLRHRHGNADHAGLAMVLDSIADLLGDEPATRATTASNPSSTRRALLIGGGGALKPSSLIFATNPCVRAADRPSLCRRRRHRHHPRDPARLSFRRRTLGGIGQRSFLPPMRNLWRDPRFDQLLHRIGPTEYWRPSGTLADYRRTN